MSEYRDKESLFKKDMGKNPIEIGASAKMANMEDEKNPLMSMGTLKEGGRLLSKGVSTYQSVGALQSQISRGFGNEKENAEGSKADRSKEEVQLETASAQSASVATTASLGKSAVQEGIKQIVVPKIMKGTSDVGKAVKVADKAGKIGKIAGVAGTVASAASLGSQVADLKHEGKQEGFVGKNEKTAKAIDTANTAVQTAGGVAGLAGVGAGGLGAAAAAGGTALAGGAGLGSAALAAGAALGPVGWAALGLGAAAMAFKKKSGSRLR